MGLAPLNNGNCYVTIKTWLSWGLLGPFSQHPGKKPGLTALSQTPMHLPFPAVLQSWLHDELEVPEQSKAGGSPGHL